MKYLFIILFFFKMTLSNGQALTTYEKKGYSLTVQFLKKLGVNEALLQKSSKMGDLEKLIVAGNFLEKLNTERGIMLMLEYEREMKEAEKLKTAIDFERDKVKKAETERKRQIAIANQKRIQQDEDEKNEIKAKEKIRVQKEYEELQNRQREQQIAIERIEKSDLHKIDKEIKNKIKGWFEKGEYEKTDVYQNRISNNFSKAFDSICYKTCIDAIEAKSGFSSKLLKYNADSEKFGIEFNFNALKFNDSLFVPVKEASIFKEEIENFEIYVYNKDWGFIDNYLTPTKIRYYNNRSKENFEFYFSNENLKFISFSASELDLNLFTNINANFNFNKFYFNQIFETKNGSEINTYAWDCLLNKKFPEALQTLERGVLIINKSDDSYLYLLTNLAHAYLFNNEFEKAHKIYIENLQTKLNNMTWENVILEDFRVFKKRGIEFSDMDRIKQELFVLNSNIEKEKLNILEKQQLIEEMAEKKKIEDKIKAEKKAKRVRTFNKIISTGIGG